MLAILASIPWSSLGTGVDRTRDTHANTSGQIATKDMLFRGGQSRMPNAISLTLMASGGAQHGGPTESLITVNLVLCLR